MATSLIHFTFTVTLLVFKSLFFAAYGAVKVLGGLLKLPGKVAMTRRLLGQSITCPWCREKNALVGRYSCNSCQANFLAAVTSPCPVCGASADYFPCSRCQGSIVIGGGL
jgi:hypothetical protein